MTGKRQDGRITQLVMGLVLSLIGGACILDARGLIEIGPIWDVWRYWPLFVIAMGVGHAFDRSTSVFVVVTEILQGFLFLAITFHWKGLNWSHFAPLLFMTLGVAWIADALIRRTPATETVSPEGDRS